MRATDFMILVREGEEADEAARQEAERCWIKSRSMIITKLLRNVQKNRMTKVTRLVDTTIFVKPIDTEMNGEPVEMYVQLGWGRPGWHGDYEQRKTNSFTIQLYLTRGVNYGSVRADETSIAKLLDEHVKFTFIHEYIHFLDEFRYKHRPSFQDQAVKLNRLGRQVSPKLHYKAYIEAPFENNAWYQALVARYLFAVRSGHLERPTSATALFKQVMSMPWVVGEEGTVAQIMAKYSFERRQSWMRRLYKLYQTQFAANTEPESAERDD